MSRSSVVSLVCLALLAPPRASASPDVDGPWLPVRNDDGIAVHRRHLAGSSLDEFRGVGILEAPLSAVLALLDDAEHRSEWLGNSVANQRIERTGQYDELFYTRTRAPWPVSDRDAVASAHLSIDPAAHEIRIEMRNATHPAWPPQKGVVRMPAFSGHWALSPAHDGAWTRVEYQVRADPGGRLPAWVGNLATKKLPHDTILGLRRQLGRRSYPDQQRQIEMDPLYRAVVGRSAR